MTTAVNIKVMRSDKGCGLKIKDGRLIDDAMVNKIMDAPFKVEITKIPEKEGGGYSARLLGFGLAVIGDGETIEEAVKDMRDYQREWLLCGTFANHYKFVETTTKF